MSSPAWTGAIPHRGRYKKDMVWINPAAQGRGESFSHKNRCRKGRFLLTLALSCLIMLPAAARAGDDGFLPFQIPPWAGDESLPPQAQEAPAAQESRYHAKGKGDAQKPLAPQDYETLLAQMAPAIEQAQPASPLEKLYAGRVSDDVRQFGYDLFANAGDAAGKNDSPAMPAGAVQDNFILNIGDKLSITFRGQRHTQGIYSVTGDGLLIVEDLPPVPAAGRTIGQVREMLEAGASDLYNTDVFVALDSVRQVGVLVAGHVRKPGRQNLTVFHTVLDALMQADGIEKTGTLRQIKLVRGGRTQIVDLYGLLVYGSAGMDLSLRDGDRIIVPPVGPTIAVTGGVKRPGIYEILPTLQPMRMKPENASEKLSLQAALDLAGGLLSPGNNRFIRLTMTPDGREKTDELAAPFAPALGDGGILVVARANEKRTETITLAGHTRQPGIHALAHASSLAALLSDPKILGPDIYPLIGVIAREDKKTLTRQLIDFPPNLVVSGQFDRRLQDGDTVTLFSRRQIMDLQKQKKETGGLEKIAYGSAAPEDDDGIGPAMRSFLKERAAFIRGAVRDPGAWPVSDGATLETLAAVAGGLTLEANTSGIEVTGTLAGSSAETGRRNINYQETDPATVAIAPGDAVRVNQESRKTDGQSVMIVGEVSHPGKYDLLPGDTLGRLLARAGGLTEQAYPDGAVFSRESDRRAEEARFRAAARELERAVAAATEKKDNPPSTEQLALARDLAGELRTVEAVGRITVEADPGVLKARPEQDLLLEPGDRIYIPRRPMTVRVHGEVLSPANLQFRADKTPGDYIDEAGGMTYYADDDRAFVLYPDGSAQPLQVSAWNHKAAFIPPGSTIVVPRDPKPFDFLTTARDFTQILSNLAITGIFLSDIQDGE